MQQYWVFEATLEGLNLERLCIANAERVLILSDDLSEVANELERNVDTNVESFHNQYRVTFGSVPPWLEKPLPKTWDFWVCNDPTGGKRPCLATDEWVAIHQPAVGCVTHTYFKDSRNGREKFFTDWRILGSPDLPDWLKTEDAK